MGVRGPLLKPSSHYAAGVLLSLSSVSSFVKEDSGTIDKYYKCTYSTEHCLQHNRERTDCVFTGTIITTIITISISILFPEIVGLSWYIYFLVFLCSLM